MILKNNKIEQSDYNTFIAALLNVDKGISYDILKGCGVGNGSRSAAHCSGIVQACIDGQKYGDYMDLEGNQVRIKKPYVDDWTSDGFLRWAISLGLLNYDYGNDACSLSRLGKKVINSKDVKFSRNRLLADAFLSYPPVSRVLSLLSDGAHMTKFEIGAQLGFEGELGFTSISQDYFIAYYCDSDAEERKRIKSNIEGDADKYARMICSWLSKLGWIKSCAENRMGNFNGQSNSLSLQTYFITPKGLTELKRAQGNSSNVQIPKIVMNEMLATKAPNAGYLRFRRALLIEALQKERTLDDLQLYYETKGESVNQETITDDINGLKRIGLNIVKKENGKYVLKDKIQSLSIPDTEEPKEDITIIKESLRKTLTAIDHEYLILIDLAYSDAATKSKKNIDARNFEIKTADLFTKELNFEGKWLGGADKPDIIVWKSGKGYVIDNKSYKKGFSVGRDNEDEMCRYLDQALKMQLNFPPNNWWLSFKESEINGIHYLFVTSFVKGDFKKYLMSINQRSGVDGGVESAINLLSFAELVKRGEFAGSDLYTLLNNDEVVISLER